MSSIVLLHLNHSSLKNSTWAGQTRKQTANRHSLIFLFFLRIYFTFKNNTRHHLPVSDDTAFYFIRQKGNKVANNIFKSPESRAWGSDKLLATFLAQSKP